MEMQNSSRNFKKKVARKLGDTSLWDGCRNSKFWILLLTKPNAAVEMLFIQFLAAITAISAYLLTCVKGCKHGVNVCGIGLTLIGTSYISVFNNPDTWVGLTPLIAFLTPAFIYFNDWGWQEVYEALFVNVHSLSLAIYNVFFVLTSFIHTVISWFTAKEELNKRGTSYVYLILKCLLSKWIKINEFFVNLLECLAVISLGIYLAYSGIDVYFGWFLIAIAFNELVIIMNDKTAELQQRPLLQF